MSPQTAAKTLKITGAGLVAISLMVAAGAYPPMDGPSVLFHDMVDWPIDGATGAYTKEARLFSAIMGGAFAALGMMLMLIVAPAIRRGDDTIRRSAIIAILTWFIVDSIGSIAAGVAANALFNCLFLAVFLAPLVMVRGKEPGGQRQNNPRQAT